MPDSGVNMDALAAAVRLCFANARDNATFSEEQCAQFLFQGKRLRGSLVNLVSATFTAAVPGVDAANDALDDLVARLNDTRETLDRYADTVEKISDVAGALDKVLTFAASV